MKRRSPKNVKQSKLAARTEPPTCIDVGNVVEKIRRDKFIRQQKAVEQSEHIANDIQNWKQKNDENMKELNEQMKVLEKRKEQIRQNMAEMNELASLLRERLAILERRKEPSGAEEAMQS